MRHYLILFGVSFASATIFPGGSEAYFYYVMKNKAVVLPIVLVATIGNTMGSFINYWLGRWAGIYLYRKPIGFSRKAIRKAKRRFKRWGSMALFLSFLPIVGDPITAVAGLLNYPLVKFFFWVLLGKLVRYGSLAVVYLYVA